MGNKAAQLDTQQAQEALDPKDNAPSSQQDQSARPATAKQEDEKTDSPPKGKDRKDNQLSNLDMRKIPTAGQVNKFREPFKKRVAAFLGTLTKGKRKASTASKKDRGDEKTDKKGGKRYRVGDKAYSQVLNGPHKGKWIEVIVTRVHPTGLIDLSVPNFKKYRVFSSACKVSPDYLSSERPEVDNTPLCVGDQAYSKILTGSSTGLWIRVLIRRVHEDGKLDIYITNFKKYKVYAHAMEVPGNLVVREPPPGDNREATPGADEEPRPPPTLQKPKDDDSPANTVKETFSPKSAPTSPTAMDPDLPAGVHSPQGGRPSRLSAPNSPRPGYKPSPGPRLSEATAMRMSDAINQALGLEVLDDFEPDFPDPASPSAMSPSADEGTAFEFDNFASTKSIEFDKEDDQTKAMEQMSAVVGFLMNIDAEDPADKSKLKLERLWKELDQDKDDKLNDEELLNMQLAIAEAWKQKARMEFEDMLKKMNLDMGAMSKSQIDMITSKFREDMLGDLDEKINDIKENKETYIKALRTDLDLDCDGVVSKADFMDTAPFVLYDQ